MKLFVGNLSFDVTDNDLRAAFEPFGQVDSASILRERQSNESRGFGFVEMPLKSEAQNAINEMNGKEFMGRSLNVNEARPMPSRPAMGGGSRGGFSDHRRDSRGRDGRKRRSNSDRDRKQRFSRRPY